MTSRWWFHACSASLLPLCRYQSWFALPSPLSRYSCFCIAITVLSGLSQYWMAHKIVHLSCHLCSLSVGRVSCRFLVSGRKPGWPISGVKYFRGQQLDKPCPRDHAQSMHNLPKDFFKGPFNLILYTIRLSSLEKVVFHGAVCANLQKECGFLWRLAPFDWADRACYQGHCSLNFFLNRICYRKCHRQKRAIKPYTYRGYSEQRQTERNLIGQCQGLIDSYHCLWTHHSINQSFL